MNKKKILGLMKIILFLQFSGVIKVIDYLQVLMIILLEFGICKENQKGYLEHKIHLFVLAGIKMIHQLLQEEMKLMFLFGTPQQYQKNLFINLNNLAKLLILLGKMKHNQQLQAFLLFIYGLLIKKKSLQEYGNGIKTTQKVLSGLVDQCSWQVQHKKIYYY